MSMLLVFAGALTSLLEGVFIKKYNSKYTAGGFLFTALVSFASMLFFLLTDSDGFHAPNGMYLYAVLSGVLYGGASFLTYVALGCGSFAVSVLLLSYSGIFSIGYGIFFLHEPISIFGCVGFAVIFLSLYLLRGKKDAQKTPFCLKWLVCILLAMIGNGMLGVVQRMQQLRFEDACNNEFMVVTLGLSAAGLFLVGLVKDGKKLPQIMKHGSMYALLAGTANGATNMLTMIVNLMLPISVASPVRTGIKTVLSFLLSVLVFREAFLKRQIVGVILGTLGLILLNF